jgi:hypothetical protein
MLSEILYDLAEADQSLGSPGFLVAGSQPAILELLLERTGHLAAAGDADNLTPRAVRVASASADSVERFL